MIFWIIIGLLAGAIAHRQVRGLADQARLQALGDRALMVAAGVLVAWAVALPWIFARY